MEEKKKVPLIKRWKNLLRRCGGERVFVALFLVLAMAAGFLGTILLPKQSFSENENRMLETLDPVDGEAIISGSMMDNVESYMCDHFPLRSFFITLNTELNLAMGKKDSGGNYSNRPAEGGVYFGQNGHLYEVLLDDQTGVFAKNCQALADFGEKAGVPLTIVPVPSGAQEQKEYLPAFAVEHDQHEELEALQQATEGKTDTQVIDLFDTLDLKKRRLLLQNRPSLEPDGSLYHVPGAGGCAGIYAPFERQHPVGKSGPAVLWNAVFQSDHL